MRLYGTLVFVSRKLKRMYAEWLNAYMGELGREASHDSSLGTTVVVLPRL